MVKEKISSAENLTDAELGSFFADALAEVPVDGKRVLVIIPDSTRTAPLATLYRLLHENIGNRVAALEYLVALGTHQPMSEEAIDNMLGRKAKGVPSYKVHNHHWDNPDQLRQIGVITKAQIEEVSGGLFGEDVVVKINKLIYEYDYLLILAPTFPHEVVGFSGGNKYFFPGISGPEILNFFHWLGAVITNRDIIGTRYTPVRQVVDMAAAMIDLPRTCFSMVIKGSGIKGIFMGAPERSYEKAADLSAQEHIRFVDTPYTDVLSMAPPMYEDVWTAGKCMYKLEPVIAKGGRLIIYAPHITEVSYTHGKLIDEIGYHVRDYFMKQMDRFSHIPRGILAHSTHVKGSGTYENGIETPNVNVVLASQIGPERCEKINLGYMDPATIDIEQWRNREDEGVLLVEKAGEILYRLKE
ncbi:lactate racemase domain-containing protein [Balneolales bacterium ANBcel1]|nr:lactate racemase domain-containing protein [Balneolales bacterium ANBcel1]